MPAFATQVPNRFVRLRSSTAGTLSVGFKPRMNTNQHEFDKKRKNVAHNRPFYTGAGPRLWRSPAAAGTKLQRAARLILVVYLHTLRLGFTTAAVGTVAIPSACNNPAPQ